MTREIADPIVETFSNLFATGKSSVSSPEHAKIRREPIAWPNGARVALTWTVIFELFPEATAVYTPEVAKQTLFGRRRGVWRLLDQFDRHQLKASFLINGYAAEKFPEAAREIRDRGHEIVGYGYTTTRYSSDLSPSKEKLEILKTLDILDRICGVRPSGWVSPDLLSGDSTLDVLAEAGIKWNGDSPNDDLPYVVNAGGRAWPSFLLRKNVTTMRSTGKTFSHRMVGPTTSLTAWMFSRGGPNTSKDAERLCTLSPLWPIRGYEISRASPHL